MNETYKKTLTTEEYLAIYQLGDFFSGSEVSRFVASKVNERISEIVRKNSVTEPEVGSDGSPIIDETGFQKTKVTPPKSIEIIFTRSELDGYFIGIKETLAKPEVKSADILAIKSICKTLGMSGRFDKYSDTVLAKAEINKDPLDDETITDPLD